MDRRNCDVTQKIFYVLNDVKGFEIATGAPYTGKLLINYGGVNFIASIEPLFESNVDDENESKKSFMEILKEHGHLLNI